MTREEAIAILQEKHDECKSFYDLAAYPEISYPETAKYMLALRVALSALQAENEEMQKHLNEFSEFLCHMTGGLLSKTNYTAQEMISAAEDYQQDVCGECDLRAENEKLRTELKKAEMELDSLLAEGETVAFDPFGAEKED